MFGIKKRKRRRAVFREVQGSVVIYCKDCRHLMFSDCYGECGLEYLGIVRPEDFCSRGEHREGVQDGLKSG